MAFELSKAHAKISFNIVSNQVFNFGMLRTKKKKMVGQKRPIYEQIIDSIEVLGIENNDYNFLNPTYISITSDSLIQKLTKYRKYRYRFVLQSLLFSSNIENDTDVIIVTCDGLNNANTAFVNKKLKNILGVCYLNQIQDWEIIKGQSKRSQVVFRESVEISNSPHIAIAFQTKNISDLSNFSVTLLASDGNNITFPETEKKLPILNFKIQIIN